MDPSTLQAFEVARPRLKDGLTVRLVENEAIVLDSAQHRIHRLNETAFFIMSQCTGDVVVDEIARRTAAAFGEEASMISAHVERTLNQMKAEGLLDTSPSV